MMLVNHFDGHNRVPTGRATARQPFFQCGGYVFAK